MLHLLKDEKRLILLELVSSFVLISVWNIWSTEIVPHLLKDEELVGFEFPGLLSPKLLRVDHAPLQLSRHHLRRGVQFGTTGMGYNTVRKGRQNEGTFDDV